MKICIYIYIVLTLGITNNSQISKQTADIIKVNPT